MRGLASNGRLDDALKLLDDMRQAGAPRNQRGEREEGVDVRIRGRQLAACISQGEVWHPMRATHQFQPLFRWGP